MRISLIFALFFSTLSFANCKVDKPIPIHRDPLDALTLESVKFDKAPKFFEKGGFDPQKDTLSLSLFEIVDDHYETGWLGGWVKVDNKLGSFGFSSWYFGSFDAQGSVEENGETITYHTKNINRYTEPQHAKNDAITEITMTVKAGAIVSLSLTSPIFKVWKSDGYMQFIAFTGKHQTLCLKSAKIKQR